MDPEKGRATMIAVMAGLVPAIHAFLVRQSKTWMLGTSPAMTIVLE
jgi:hypothetical protein